MESLKPIHGRAHKSILIVEDDDLCRASISKLLSVLGFPVHTAQCGEQAIEILERNADLVGVVLLDATLHGLSGVDTFRELRAIRSDLPIVITSGFDQGSVDLQYQGLDYSGFLYKPSRPAQIIGMLEQFVVEPTAHTATA